MPYKDPIKAKENAALRSRRWRERNPEKAKEVARKSARKIRGYIGPEERSRRATARNLKRWADFDWRSANESKIVGALNAPQSVAKRTPNIRKTYELLDLRNLSRDRMNDLRLRPFFKKKLYTSWQARRKPSKPELALFAALTLRGVSGLKAQYKFGWYDLDIAHLPSKTDIEVDGPYWHKGERIARDRKRDKFLRSRGWSVLRVKLVKNQVTDKDFSRLLRRLVA